MLLQKFVANNVPSGISSVNFDAKWIKFCEFKMEPWKYFCFLDFDAKWIEFG